MNNESPNQLKVPYNRVHLSLYTLLFGGATALFAYIIWHTPPDRAFWVNSAVGLLFFACGWVVLGYIGALIRNFFKKDGFVIDDNGVELHTFPQTLRTKLDWKDIESVMLQDYSSNVLLSPTLIFKIKPEAISKYSPYLNLFQRIIRLFLHDKPIKTNLNAGQLRIKREELLESVEKYRKIESLPLI
ncbi:MAG: hypothetical protein RI894_395 [Bacteroidota bacterium]|jgi:hypothetical protein